MFEGRPEEWLPVRVTHLGELFWSGRAEKKTVTVVELNHDSQYLEKVEVPPNPIFEPEASDGQV